MNMNHSHFLINSEYQIKIYRRCFIIRFNYVKNVSAGGSADEYDSGITAAGNWQNFYIYGNYLEDVHIGGFLYQGPNGDPNYYYDDCADFNAGNDTTVTQNLYFFSKVRNN